MAVMADEFKALLTMNNSAYGTYSKSKVIELANKWKERKKLIYRQDPCKDLHFTLTGIGVLGIEKICSSKTCDLITEIKVRIGDIPWIARRLFEVYKVESTGGILKDDNEVLMKDVTSWTPVPHRYPDSDAISLGSEEYTFLAKLAERDDLIQAGRVGYKTFMLIYPCMKNNNSLFYQFEDGSELLSSTGGAEDIVLTVKKG